jgi:hypothetical protein
VVVASSTATSRPPAVIDQNLEGISGTYENQTFFNCIFRKLKGLVLKNCDLNRSTFVTDKLEDALGLTVTLDCHSFDNVEFSPLLFDLFLCLAIKSRGNTEKRRKLIDVVGRERVYELLSKMKALEQ